MKGQPTTLALELSQRDGTVSMVNSKGINLTREVNTGSRDDDTVLPMISEIANELSITPRSIELVVVSVGPGGFTGLRTSVAIAKMLALVSSATIVPVETAIVTVASSSVNKKAYFVLSGVKQDSFWLSKVYKKDNSWCCTASISCVKELKNVITEVDGVFVDSFAPDSISDICVLSGVTPYTSLPNAKSLLDIGIQLHENGVSIDPMKLSPLYPREPEAVRAWNALHKK
jgi:tRNA threonylcarbamoyl adenosine modification protein YeaZ